MTQSIELLLDDALDASVRAQWEALKQASLPSLARHTGATNRPHVTLAVASRIPVPVEAALNDLSDHLPLPVRLGSLMLFGGRTPRRFILVRLVIPSMALLTLQAAAAQQVESLPGTGSYLRPGAWTGHVTLARDIGSDLIAIALEVLGEVGDLAGEAVAVRRWDSVEKRAWLLS